MKEKVTQIEKAHGRWLTLWERLGAKGNPEEIFNDLVNRYREPHRFYHNFEHIQDCLDNFASVRGMLVEPEAVELAIWYHDAVYDPKAKDKDNEEQSAKLAVEMVKRALLPEEFGQRVSDLIMVTKHASPPKDFDSQVLADIDLSILGASKERFDRYEQEIWQEYKSWVPRELYTEERAKFLGLFLDSKIIFSTQFFFARYERQARINIENLLERL